MEVSDNRKPRRRRWQVACRFWTEKEKEEGKDEDDCRKKHNVAKICLLKFEEHCTKDGNAVG